MVNHVYDSNDWLYLINKEFYNIFKFYKDNKSQNNIYQDIMIDCKIIISQANSLKSRPNMKLPLETNT
jgi:hypothetical protein